MGRPKKPDGEKLSAVERKHRSRNNNENRERENQKAERNMLWSSRSEQRKRKKS